MDNAPAYSVYSPAQTLVAQNRHSTVTVRPDTRTQPTRSTN